MESRWSFPACGSSGTEGHHGTDEGRRPRVGAAGVPVAVIDHRPFGKDREAWEREAAKVLAEHRVDLIVFAGFMRLVTPFFISRFPNRIFNIHPSLLPAFPRAP